MPDNKQLPENQITWLDKMLLKFWPKRTMHRLAKKMKVGNIVFDKLHDVFSKTETIDIFPAAGNQRGFIMVFDHETAIFFYQDGDHFAYDGFEMGEYVKGDVTIFDNLKNKDLNPYPPEPEDKAAGEIN